MLPPGSEVYHVKATPVRVVGKNLHHNAGLVVYSKFFYAIMCSSGEDVPSKAVMFGIFIFTRLGVFIISRASLELIGMESSGGLPLSVSFRGIVMGLVGWQDPMSCAFFLSSLLLSTND